mgnify:CR=1 FL=1
MKKLLFSLAMLFGVSTMLYASFPVTEQSSEQSTEKQIISQEIPSLISTVRSGGPGFGIAALVCGIIGFFVLPFILGPLAIIFGALGLKNRGRGMAITGMILGMLQVLMVVVLILALAMFLGSSGGFMVW